MMTIRRPLLWLAAAFVLGEVSALPEFGRGPRFAAVVCFLFIVLFLLDFKGKRTVPVPAAVRSSAVSRKQFCCRTLLLLFFCLGVLRAASVAAEFHAPEQTAFFAQYAPRNEGEFDYGLYLKGYGVSSEAERERFRAGGLLASDLPYFSQLGQLKQLCTETLNTVLPEKDAGVCRALLLGDKSEMDEQLRSLYQSQGIAHLLAVSGLHLSIIGMGFYRLLRRTGLGLSSAGLFASALVLSYGFLTGAQGSAMRAVIMLLVRFLSLRLGKSYDTLSALSLAALLLAFTQPYFLLQSGFQLSFGAILSISLLGDHLIHALELGRTNFRRSSAPGVFPPELTVASMQPHRFACSRVSAAAKLSAPAKTLLISLCIQFFTLPIILYHFFVFPLYGILLNFLVIPLMVFVVVSGLLVLFFGLGGRLLAALLSNIGPAAEIEDFFQFLAKACGGAGHYILLFYEKLCEFTAALPCSSLVLGQPEASDLLYYYGLLALFYCLFFVPLLSAPYLCAGDNAHTKYSTHTKHRAHVKSSAQAKSGAETAFAAFLHIFHFAASTHMFRVFRRFRLTPSLHVLASFQRALHVPRLYTLPSFRRCTLFFCCLIFSATFLFSKPDPSDLTVKAIDVGQGDGFLLRFRNQNVLLDAGSSSEKELGKYTLRPFLLSQGIGELDAVFVSHNDLDHTSGLLYLCEEVPEICIRQVVLPKAAESSEAYVELKNAFQQKIAVQEHSMFQSRFLNNKRKAAALSFLSTGDIYPLAPDDASFLSETASLRCLYEGRPDSPEVNSHSPVLLLQYGDFSMLFTGDMTKGDEALLAKELRAADPPPDLPSSLTVYKAAHHGSKTSNSDALLKLFWPRYALVSCAARNSYGHPHQEVTDRFARYGMELLKTAEYGQINLRTDGNQLWIEAPFQPAR